MLFGLMILTIVLDSPNFINYNTVLGINAFL